MLLIYSLIAVFIAWIWVDYFRLIDLFHKEDLGKLLMMFVGGALSTLPVLGLDSLIGHLDFMNLNGNMFHDFMYCFLGIGLVEELAKILPVIVAYKFVQKNAPEPIDLLAFFCVSALGFSAAENVIYFFNKGPDLITGRAILATVSHMFNTALFTYGIIRYKYYFSNNNFFVILVYFILAALSHGFYDFWLLYDFGPGGKFVTIFYFLITVSVFAIILNNAINNSAYFTYSKVIDSAKVSSRLLIYYGSVFLLQFLLLWNATSFIEAWADLFGSLIFIGFIVTVSVIRLSRFKLIRNRWHPIRIELPFTFDNSPTLPGDGGSSFKIRGDSYNESFINAFYNEYFLLVPLSRDSPYLEEVRVAYIEEKIFLKGDDTFYLVRVYANLENAIAFSLLIKPKLRGRSFIEDKYPIVALLKYDTEFDMNDNNKNLNDFEFLEWAYIKPRQHYR